MSRALSNKAVTPQKPSLAPPSSAQIPKNPMVAAQQTPKRIQSPASLSKQPPTKLQKIRDEPPEPPIIYMPPEITYLENSAILTEEQIQKLLKFGHELDGKEVGIFETKEGKNAGKMSIFIDGEWACHLDNIKRKPSLLKAVTRLAKEQNEKKFLEERNIIVEGQNYQDNAVLPVNQDFCNWMGEMVAQQDLTNQLLKENNSLLKAFMEAFLEKPIEIPQVEEESQIIA